MPLLTSPIDGSPMKQVHRFGIEIDVCPTSGGIWLDKGELEKLMALLREEAMAEQAAAGDTPPKGKKRWKDTAHHHSASGYAGHGHGHGYKRKKESKMSRVMDLFDF